MNILRNKITKLNLLLLNFIKKTDKKQPKKYYFWGMNNLFNAFFDQNHHTNHLFNSVNHLQGGFYVQKGRKYDLQRWYFKLKRWKI